MEPEGTAACEFLKWDSAFFRVRIARVLGRRMDAQRAAAVEAWRRAERIRCVYFLAELSDAAGIRAAEDNGFRMVDVRLTYGRAVPAPGLQEVESAAFRIRAARPEDLPCLEEIAGSSYHESRFYSDPHFPRADCAALYQTWIRRSCCEGFAEAVFVAERAGEATGYISCHLEKGGAASGRIGLLGVASQARGEGLGPSLLAAALAWFGAQQVAEVSLVTQGRNLAAQRLYQRCGFLVQAAGVWFHKWHETEGRP